MSVFKKFIIYIKNIFVNNKKIDNNIKNNDSENIIIEDQVTQNCCDPYDQIVVGDIIWGKRYKNENQMQMIPEGHREGPFIVLAVQDGKLFCAQGKGIPPYQRHSNICFCIDDRDYALTKATYFNLMRLVSIDRNLFIQKLDKLKESDIDKLYRQIKINHKTYYTNESKLIRLNMPIQIGDIISNNNENYIIIDIDNNKFICIHLNNKKDFKKLSELNINNFYDLDYSKTYIIENSANIKHINSISDNTLKYILKEQKQYLDTKKHVQEIKRGSVLLNNGKYYYVYGEECQYWLTFQIKETKDTDLEELKIKDELFYTNYNDEKINKNENLKNIYVCKEDEVDKIKQLRKSYKKAKKNIELYGTSEFVYFNIGDIVANRNYRNKPYIIVELHKNTYECLSIENLKKGIYDIVFIKRTDCKLLKDFVINGVKWFEKYRNFDLKKIKDRNILKQILQTQTEFLEREQEQKKSTIENNTINELEENKSITLNTKIKINDFSEETFVVKEVLGEMLVCISTLDLGVKNPKKHYFNKNNVIIVLEKQKRK